ncbi:hypothetical protein ACJ7V3_07840 [Halomonas elongata]|uniref:hypothetical protein n=1 Tax=Halomonas elongata TaxID=2746 RepID=UPI0038D4F2F9
MYQLSIASDRTFGSARRYYDCATLLFPLMVYFAGAKMIKGIVICFAFLVVQLLLLNQIDNRLNAASRDVRQASSVTHVAQREGKEEEGEESMS